MSERIEFDQVQIGRGLVPVAQHGFVLIEDGVITLLDSDRTPIASGPIAEATARPIRFTRGQSLSMTVGGDRFNVSPGWGRISQRYDLLLGSDVKTLAGLLQHVVEHDGALPPPA